MRFTVLGHSNVRNLLLNLQKETLLSIQRLGHALEALVEELRDDDQSKWQYPANVHSRSYH
ncbi:hypothetical protein N7537_007758 [Penicillium hordei]|jgi:hypothetical protein|uniref:Uncharacterized protein n=1 Tax=Penicillium hordei TaxID=40994 RepID=A0AAD6DZM9_9EURO|nr:uncharacterized protein N7537_007758 [Penicillium hordei]KAJ5597674.1 hypothetical protein N7537_007758 [Penicillium hordei]